jgi:hypothetical protein
MAARHPGQVGDSQAVAGSPGATIKARALFVAALRLLSRPQGGEQPSLLGLVSRPT